MTQPKSGRWKGYVFVGISIVATSNVYLFSKAALEEVSLMQFGLYWFFFGMSWNLIFNFFSGKIRCIRKVSKRARWLLVLIGLLEVGGTSLFFYSISQMENPAIVSFIANTGPIFVGLLGFMVLGERFTRIELAGLFITLSGAFLISYKPSSLSEDLFIDGTQYVVLSSLLFATSSIIIKKNINAFDTTVLSLNRSFFIFGAALLGIMISGQAWLIPGKALGNIAIGSILGPFLTVYAGYSALKFIEASRASVLGSLKGLVVMAGSWLMFGILPLPYQITGGIISILGVILISTGKKGLRIFDLRYKIISRKEK